MILELSQDQLQYRDRVRAFAEAAVAPAAARIDETDRFPSDVVARAGEEGLLGVPVPAEWGGQGRDYLSYTLAIEAIGEASATVAVVLVVNNSLVAEPVARYGSAAQKAHWLPLLASGQALGAFALSEADAGTDAARLQTTATLQADGSYRLTGRKVWVANAEVAGLAIVFAMVDGGGTNPGVTAFLVPFDTPGLTRAERNEALGVRGLGCFDVVFDQVHVGADGILGEPGAGFAVARWALEGGRVAIAAQALGLAQAAVNQAVRYARSRRTFGQPIASYEAVQWMIVDAATALEAARMLTYKAATVRHLEQEAAVAAAMAKLHASETAAQATNCAMQVFGAAGYRRGSVVERLFRDGRAVEIYQGTSEAQRMIIAAHLLHGPRR